MDPFERRWSSLRNGDLLDRAEEAAASSRAADSWSWREHGHDARRQRLACPSL